MPAPTPPPAKASRWHTAACFTTPPFPLCHLTSAFFTAERISSFLSCIRWHVANDDTATAASAAGMLATPPPPDVNLDAIEGAMAGAASAADVSFESSDIGVFPLPLPTEQTDLYDGGDNGNEHSATVARDSRKRKYSPAKLARRQARIAQQDADSFANGGLGSGVL